MNILPKYEYVKLAERPKLEESKMHLTAYNKAKIPVLRKCIV